MSAHDWGRGIYAITDTTLLPDDAQLLGGCEAALRGGLALLQYRDKSGNDELRWRQARALAALCETYDVPLIVNDDLALAQRLRAEGFSSVGLHLGQCDGSLREARARLGFDAIIGATCHARLDFAERATADGASYLAFGRFFASRTKPEAPPASLELLARAGRFGLPRVAIGGIDSDNAVKARDAGADLLATVHAVFGGADPEACVRELNRCLKRHAPEFIHRA